MWGTTPSQLLGLRNGSLEAVLIDVVLAGRILDEEYADHADATVDVAAPVASEWEVPVELQGLI